MKLKVCLVKYKQTKNTLFLYITFPGGVLPLAYVMHGKGTDLSHLSAPIVTKGWGDGEGWEWGGGGVLCVSCVARPPQITGNLILIVLYGLVLAGSAKLISGAL